MQFTKTECPTIMDGKVIRWKCGEAEINASRHGFSLTGFWPVMTSRESLDAVTSQLDAAYAEYLELRRNNR